MSAMPLRLPRWVDTADEQIDALWDIFRGRPALDRVFYAASAAGDFSAVWHAYNIARLVGTPTGRARFARLAVALTVESLLVNQGIKRLFDRDRPVPTADRPHYVRTPHSSSFPSGHASSATMAALLVGERSRLAPATAAVAAVVATSRLHVRMHHASDVAAGVAVGAGLAAIWKRVWPLR